MRLLMSGSSGFVGVSLSEYLRRRGYEVVPYQRSQEPPTGSFDAIIHLAARVHQMTESADSAEVERLFKESNVDLTDHLLRLAEERKIKRFIFFSSVKAVGEENDQVYVPTSPLRPQDAYGRSKAAAESLVENWARQNKAEFLILRCPLIYGQGDRANFARLIQFTVRAPVLPFANVKNRRSIFALENLCDLTHFALNSKKIWNHTLHPSDGEPISLAELTRIIAAAADKMRITLPIPRIIYLLGLNALGKRSLAVRLFGDLETRDPFLFDELKWMPPHTTESSVKKLVKSLCHRSRSS